jgi:hypothetical protein
VNLLIERPLLNERQIAAARHALMRWFGSHDYLRELIMPCRPEIRGLSQMERAKVMLLEWDSFDHTIQYKDEILSLLWEYVENFGQFYDDAKKKYVVRREIPIYRGATRKEAETAHLYGYGLSWTLSKEWAKSFARTLNRHKTAEPVLLESRIDKRSVIAFIFDRCEAEAIVDSDMLRAEVVVTPLL